MVDEPTFEAILNEIKVHQRQGQVAELLVDKFYQKIQLRTVGSMAWASALVEENPGVEITPKNENKQAYYFFSSQLRPGSGLIRVFGGRPEGPGGTLTCFLSSKDGRDLYLVAAGHILSNFWNRKDVRGTKKRRVERKGAIEASIYRYQKGFPATNSTRFLGKLEYLSEKPVFSNPVSEDSTTDPDNLSKEQFYEDVGIVRLREGIDIVQRTTCYGTFGESSSEDGENEEAEVDQKVMKCGAEETHGTFAVVETPRTEVSIYGPEGVLYQLHDQVILSSRRTAFSSDKTDPPKRGYADRYTGYQDAFAVPGDSGTMVVDRKSRKPVGMLIAGSVLDGRYVVTPIKALRKFWEREELDLVMRRG